MRERGERRDSRGKWAGGERAREGERERGSWVGLGWEKEGLGWLFLFLSFLFLLLNYSSNLFEFK
jgi:hypothetical protein